MKPLLKVALLFSVIPMAISACSDIKKYVYNAVENSNTDTYVSGKCYQVSYKNVSETAYLIALPNNPEADPSEYTYDFSWNNDIRNSYLEFTGGLNGKKITRVFVVAENVLKVNFNGVCKDSNATYGYIKIYRYAFTANVKKLEDKNLFVYFAIGEQASLLVDKPVINDDGTIAE